MQQILDFPKTSICTFDSFIVCDGSAAALQFARRVADPGDADNLLYLYGPSGSGKSHLLKAIGQALVAAGSGPVPILSCSDVLTVDDFFKQPLDVAALMVDDLHLLRDDPALRAGLWQLFNDFYSSGRILALAGLHHPRELPLLDDHLVSRLLWGLIARVDASDDTSRRMILKKIADDRQVRVPDDVVDYVLMTTSREVGDLIESFEALYRLSISKKRKITVSLAREANELNMNVGLE
ncbi:DnaA/Hda family protein [Pelotalea chapellei]|uniref:DnaA regulatory inactivator Hda n=1 Tax=Pelotalea chapellei TaxID=44671 RepID=A0ABS5U815_9BACT|nr:DnaA/Hda family protein [Pelotalea chapellei]MBT1071795.1 DnaA regulatory inactivator Hda [Pelotalea chapellei]